MDVRDRQLIDELVEELKDLWVDYHYTVCGFNLGENTRFFEHKDCKLPPSKLLLDYIDNSLDKCEYCGKGFKKVRPWQKFCEKRCTKADWRMRHKQDKVMAGEI